MTLLNMHTDMFDNLQFEFSFLDVYSKYYYWTEHLRRLTAGKQYDTTRDTQGCFGLNERDAAFWVSPLEITGEKNFIENVNNIANWKTRVMRTQTHFVTIGITLPLAQVDVGTSTERRREARRFV